MTAASRNCPKCRKAILVFATAERRNVACPSCGANLQLDGDSLTPAVAASSTRSRAARPTEQEPRRSGVPEATAPTDADPAAGLIALAAVALIVIVCGGLGAVLFLSRRPKPPSFVAIADSSRDLARRPMARDLNPAQDQPPVDAAPLMTATSPQLPPAKPVDGSRAQAAPAPASLATVVDDVRHSVATIIVDADWMGTRGGFGSGFVVGRGRWLATNLHVVAGAGHLKAVRKRDDRDDWIDIDVSGFVACDPKKDLVVLVLEKDWPSPPLRLAHRRIHLGEDVFAVGTPKGLSETVTRGIVSQLRSAGDLGRHELGPKTAIIQTDAFMTNGNSGGPLCSALGEVIGINSFVMKDAADNVQFQFAVAAEELTRLLGRAHAPRPLRDLPRDGD